MILAVSRSKTAFWTGLHSNYVLFSHGLQRLGILNIIRILILSISHWNRGPPNCLWHTATLTRKTEFDRSDQTPRESRDLSELDSAPKGFDQTPYRKKVRALCIFAVFVLFWRCAEVPPHASSWPPRRLSAFVIGDLELPAQKNTKTAKIQSALTFF